MRLSIIIPVHNGAGYLHMSLGALEQFDRDKVEVIVVDDASSDNTGRILKEYVIKAIRLEKKSGPGFARNIGARASSGEIILFCDADVVLPPDTPQIVDEFFQKERTESILSGIYTTDRTRGGVLARYRNLKERHEELSRGSVNFACRSSFFSIKKEVFVRVGGFDEQWPYAHCEDTIFCAALKNSNIRVHVNSELEARHIKSYTLFSLLRQAFARATAGYFAARKIGKEFMDNYYNRNTRINYFLEILSPALVLISAIAYLLFRANMLLLSFFGFNLLFYYSQRKFYAYVQKIYGKGFVIVCFALRFAEILATDTALACLMFWPWRKKAGA